MNCPAVFKLRGTRYPCDRPTSSVHHQDHYHDILIDKAHRAGIRVYWHKVIEGKVHRRLPVERCSVCRRQGHTSDVCLLNRSFAVAVRAGNGVE